MGVQLSAQGAVIKTAYEAEANAYTDAKNTKLAGIETGADATDATNVNAAGAVMESDFNATTFLYATADDTPQPKTPAETLAILSGTAAAEFLFNTKKVGGIVDPTTPQQAATKNYADTNLYGYPILAGGPMTDGFVLAYDAANGRFEMAAYLPLAGGTMLGSLNMGGCDINNALNIIAQTPSGVCFESDLGVPMLSVGYASQEIKVRTILNMEGNILYGTSAMIYNNASELTIATGIVTATQSYHTIDTEADAASDDLVRINGGTAGMKLMITTAHPSRAVVAKNGTGNLLLEADRTLDNTADTLSLFYNGTNWLETGFANNGA